jgi:hypothetical protein
MTVNVSSLVTLLPKSYFAVGHQNLKLVKKSKLQSLVTVYPLNGMLCQLE